MPWLQKLLSLIISEIVADKQQPQLDVNFIVNILNKLCLLRNPNTIAVISQFPKR